MLSRPLSQGPRSQRSRSLIQRCQQMLRGLRQLPQQWPVAVAEGQRAARATRAELWQQFLQRPPH